MRLYEFEGKALLKKAGVATPRFLLVSSAQHLDTSTLKFPVYCKVQVLTGSRADRGGVQRCETVKEVSTFCKKWLGKRFDGEVVPSILIEEVVDADRQVYVGIRWDTETRTPVLMVSQKGGTHIEERTESMQTTSIDITHPKIASIYQQLWNAFYENDATLVEINPLFVLKDGSVVAADAKVELDDVAEFRHPEWQEYTKRSLFARPPTAMEEEAKRINAMDHRGVAGASFFEFDGEIGIMASGGGASLLAMDALMASGYKPANYTEYSGNPSREKVAALTKLVLSKKGLKGLWVVGGNANFTDIYETLAGLMDGLEATKPKVKYPIVIRRGGPRWEEAFVMVKERAAKGGYDITLFGPDASMLDTVPVLVQKMKAKHGNTH